MKNPIIPTATVAIAATLAIPNDCKKLTMLLLLLISTLPIDTFSLIRLACSTHYKWLYDAGLRTFERNKLCNMIPSRQFLPTNS